MTALEAARQLGILKTTLMPLLRQGQFPNAHKVGGVWDIPAADVEAYAAQLKARGYDTIKAKRLASIIGKIEGVGTMNDVANLTQSNLSQDELEARAKSLLRDLRAVQAEINRRYNARQTPAKAVCGHGARDKTGLHCDCPTCANYVSF